MSKNLTQLILTGFFFYNFLNNTVAQSYGGQRVEYTINIDFNIKKHQFSGDQKIIYYNNSPDTLNKVFIHLYFNAFQPGSMMDIRSQTIEDPDNRVGDRISKLKEDEIGYHRITKVLQDGKEPSYETQGTVLEIKLTDPILPLHSSVFELEYDSQVPLQIRRSGRDSKEGIDYSMSQWYPKMAEYDERGWHAHPYIAREFYAPWGDFNVNITIDSEYVLAGTGILQNANEIGYGYQDDNVSIQPRPKKLTWRFEAKNVHDFVWAADPDYTHKKATVPGGPQLHFFYQEGEATDAWKDLPALTVKAFEFVEENYGEYPWSDYSIIQGGDGGMEYPMATLITGERNLQSLVGVTVHEVLHTWYQGLLATNESYYAWMDEGFTTYATAETMNHIFENPSRTQESNYQVYNYLTTTGKEEPLSTHSDHFLTNTAYSLGSYYKGAVALGQMNYLVGRITTAKALKRYYYEWRFKHPNANDWIRVFEKESGLELDWYLDYWINSTHTIDYAIDSVFANNDQTEVKLKKVGQMPMPMDVVVTFADGSQKIFYAPLVIMRGEKPNDRPLERVTLPDWPWTNPYYTFKIDRPIDEIKVIEIDDTGYMADVDRGNNKWEND